MGTGTKELRRGPTSQLPRYNQPCQNLPKGVRVSQATLTKVFAGSQLPSNPPALPSSPWMRKRRVLGHLLYAAN